MQYPAKAWSKAVAAVGEEDAVKYLRLWQAHKPKRKCAICDGVVGCTVREDRPTGVEGEVQTWYYHESCWSELTQVRTQPVAIRDVLLASQRRDVVNYSISPMAGAYEPQDPTQFKAGGQ